MSRFIDNEDNTVTDTQTGLVWTKNTIAIDVTHQKAEQKVAEMGDQWRLPTVQELFTLVDHDTHAPAIDTETFPDTESDWYWTNTPASWNGAARWVVYFGNGYVDFKHRNYNGCVRAVRAGQ